MTAYAAELEAATGEHLARCVLLFLSPTGVVERTVDDIDMATAQVFDAVRSR